MRKNKPNIKKSVQTHQIEATSIDHHYELSEDLFPTLLDPEGTLADAYVHHLKNEIEKNEPF